MSETNYQRLFGTPERAAETLYATVMSCALGNDCGFEVGEDGMRSLHGERHECPMKRFRDGTCCFGEDVAGLDSWLHGDYLREEARND